MFGPQDLEPTPTPTEVGSGVHVSEFVRVLRGLQPSVLVKCSDGYYYIIDKPSSAADEESLLAASLGTKIAKVLGLPVVHHRNVIVDTYLTYKDATRLGLRSLEAALIQPGIYYAGRLAGDISGTGWAIPHLSRSRWSCVTNREDFVGMRLLEIWSGCHREQRAMFVRSEMGETLSARFVDTNRLFTNLEITPSILHVELEPTTVPCPYSDLWTERLLHEWIARIKEQASAVLQDSCARLESNAPILIKLSRLVAALLARTDLMRQQL